MKVIIKQIIVFNEFGSKRHVEFNDGLNIVTGDSKTGKSALIEIVDFCLFSSRSSIPRGKITEFASLFVTIFQVNEFYIVVGRPAFDKGNIREAYLNIELDYNKINKIEYSYFDNLSKKPIKDDVQTEFEQYLGLSINQLTIDDDEKKKLGKLSIRDAVPFLFQHQNLIANKHALFYRFDDFIKRKRVIEAFPVLLGVVDEEYYEYSKQQKELERKIEVEKKIIEKINLRHHDELKVIEEYIQLYYTQLGRTLEDSLNLAELKKIGINLPIPPEIIIDQTKIFNELSRFEKEREELYEERLEIEKALSSLYNNSTGSLEYVRELIKVNAITKSDAAVTENIKCPICENDVKDLNDNIQEIENSRKKLIEELTKVGSFAQDNSNAVKTLRKQKSNIDGKINRLAKNIDLLIKKDNSIKEKSNKREKLFYEKGKIESIINGIIENNVLKGENKNLRELESELLQLKEKLKKYNLNAFYEKISETLKLNMDRIASKLDFEEELKPIDFHFNFLDFSFYHSKKDKIRLDEMGSGANWLACHLSIFVSFLHLSCAYKKSIIPTFLMLDQPSQVYFPRTAKKDLLDNEEKQKYDDNIIQVNKIFKTLNEEILLIEKQTGIKPQIIVLEHANDNEIQQFITKEWNKSKGEGLI